MSAFDTVVRLVYLGAAVCFVLGLHLMNAPATARRGNRLSAAGMVAGVAATVALAVHAGSVTVTGWVVLLAGAAVGAGAAYVLKRREREQWDEYDPSRPIKATDQVGNESAVAPADAAFAPTTAKPVTPKATTTTATTPAIGDEKKDQTSSAQHSPTVARMASGTKDS